MSGAHDQGSGGRPVPPAGLSRTSVPTLTPMPWTPTVEEGKLRTLAITRNITVDGSIEMLGDWFDPQGQADVDNSDLLDELHRQDGEADGFLLGRRTFEDLRG